MTDASPNPAIKKTNPKRRIPTDNRRRSIVHRAAQACVAKEEWAHISKLVMGFATPSPMLYRINTKRFLLVEAQHIASQYEVDPCEACERAQKLLSQLPETWSSVLLAEFERFNLELAEIVRPSTALASGKQATNLSAEIAAQTALQ